MFKNLILTITSTLLVMTGASALMAVATAPNVSANDSCTSDFLGLPAWYRGLTTNDGRCEIASPEAVGGLDKFIWTVVLNLIQALIMIVGYMAVIFIVIGGFRYITAAGSSDQITAAKNTIKNAIIGLIIALASVAIVDAIARAIPG